MFFLIKNIDSPLLSPLYKKKLDCQGFLYKKSLIETKKRLKKTTLWIRFKYFYPSNQNFIYLVL